MDANCTAMVALSSSSFLLSALSINLVAATIAIPILTWASTKLWRGAQTQKFDYNLRILVQMHLFGFLLHCFGRMVLHTLDLYNYNFRKPCDMVPDIYRCFIFRLMYNGGMWITTCTAVSIVIERCVATFLMDSYQQFNIWLGALLALLQIGVAAIPMSLAYSNTKFDGVFMPYCSVYMPGHPEIAQANSIAAILAQFGARVLFSVLFRLNKSHREKMLTSTLATRFQLEQNKISMQCLKIYANLSTVYLFSQTISFMILFDHSPLMPKQHYLAFMEFNIQLPLYGILTVALVALRNNSLSNKVQVDLKHHVELQSNVYHENFDRMMNAPAFPARKKTFFGCITI